MAFNIHQSNPGHLLYRRVEVECDAATVSIVVRCFLVLLLDDKNISLRGTVGTGHSWFTAISHSRARGAAVLVGGPQIRVLGVVERRIKDTGLSIGRVSTIGGFRFNGHPIHAKPLVFDIVTVLEIIAIRSFIKMNAHRLASPRQLSFVGALELDRGLQTRMEEWNVI